MAYAQSILYACKKLGIHPTDLGMDIKIMRDALRQDPGRRSLKKIDHLCDFLAAWQSFGAWEDSFTALKKSYRKLALHYHPDRNPGKANEEKLKQLNVAFDLIEEIYAEATEDFIENGAPVFTAKEGALAEKMQRARRFVAAAIPRDIRQQRLPFLNRDAIIGVQASTTSSSLKDYVDIIMLPEEHYARAKSYLATPGMIFSMRFGSADTPFVPRNVWMVRVPDDIEDVQAYARNYFLEKFGLKEPDKKK